MISTNLLIRNTNSLTVARKQIGCYQLILMTTIQLNNPQFILLSPLHNISAFYQRTFLTISTLSILIAIISSSAVGVSTTFLTISTLSILIAIISCPTATSLSNLPHYQYTIHTHSNHQLGLLVLPL
jgi:hypothetical protein